MSDKPTSAKPITVGAFTFRCYRSGILRYVWRTDCQRLSVGRNGNAETYWASVDGVGILGKRRWKRFRSMSSAMATAVKLATKGTPDARK